MNYTLDRRMDKGFVAIISCISLFMLMACGSNDAQLGNCWWKYGSGYHIGDMLEELDKNVRNDTIFKSNKPVATVYHVDNSLIGSHGELIIQSLDTHEFGYYHRKQSKTTANNK
jgi:hypothetical protein